MFVKSGPVELTSLSAQYTYAPCTSWLCCQLSHSIDSTIVEVGIAKVNAPHVQNYIIIENSI